MKLQVLIPVALLCGLQLKAQTNSVSFAEEFQVYDEASDTLDIPVILSRQNTDLVSVDLTLVSDFGTATEGVDFELLNDSLQFPPTGSDTQYAQLYIINDTLAEKAEYFALLLNNPVNADTDEEFASLYIRDNDYVAPVARNNINLKHLGSFPIPLNGSSAEIVAYDSASNSLFVVNSENTVLHILDFSNPAALTETAAIDMSVYGGGINSTATHEGIVVVAVEAATKTDAGKVVFLDTDGTYIHEVDAGALPDMVTFTPDGKYVLVANEGEPNGDYSIDPEGSISIIDIQNGIQNAQVTQVTFNALDGQEQQLRDLGVRIFGANNPTVSKDFEPEYITISANSDTAYITLQENNAIAVLDINNMTIAQILPLNATDHSLIENALDASDDHSEVLIANWSVNGLFMPDAIDNFEINNQRYLITANEGDAREYDNLEEEIRIGKNDYVLDPTLFPQADLLKEKFNLGRLNAVNTLGDTDGDGDFDKIYVMGGRSFSIWSTDGDLVFNSGDQFEQIIYADPVFGNLFNANNEEENTPKNRSDNKGVEPEGVTIGVINDTIYSFIALERIGGIMVYDVSTPQAPVFVQYVNTRDTALIGDDLGTEGLIFLPKEKNPLDKHFLITANEVSGTVAVFEVESAEAPNSLAETPLNRHGFTVYPNPVQNSMLYFSRTIDGQLYDIHGRLLKSFKHANKLNTAGIPKGTYILKTQGFKSRKIVLP